AAKHHLARLAAKRDNVASLAAAAANNKKVKKATKTKTKTAAGGKTRTAPSAQSDVVAGVTISHPGRVIDPATGMTKLQLAHYYDWVAPHLLSEIGDRPVSLLRCPEGISGDRFFQRHPAMGMEDKVTTVTESGVPGAEDLICIRDRTELITLVQF